MSSSLSSLSSSSANVEMVVSKRESGVLLFIRYSILCTKKRPPPPQKRDNKKNTPQRYFDGDATFLLWDFEDAAGRFGALRLGGREENP